MSRFSFLLVLALCLTVVSGCASSRSSQSARSARGVEYVPPEPAARAAIAESDRNSFARPVMATRAELELYMKLLASDPRSESSHSEYPNWDTERSIAAVQHGLLGELLRQLDTGWTMSAGEFDLLRTLPAVLEARNNSLMVPAHGNSVRVARDKLRTQPLPSQWLALPQSLPVPQGGSLAEAAASQRAYASLIQMGLANNTLPAYQTRSFWEAEAASALLFSGLIEAQHRQGASSATTAGLAKQDGLLSRALVTYYMPEILPGVQERMRHELTQAHFLRIRGHSVNDHRAALSFISWMTSDNVASLDDAETEGAHSLWLVARENLRGNFRLEALPQGDGITASTSE